MPPVACHLFSYVIWYLSSCPSVNFIYIEVFFMGLYRYVKKVTYLYFSKTLLPHMDTGGLLRSNAPCLSIWSALPDVGMLQRGLVPRFLKSQGMNGAADTLAVYLVSSQSGRQCCNREVPCLYAGCSTWNGGKLSNSWFDGMTWLFLATA